MNIKAIRTLLSSPHLFAFLSLFQDVGVVSRVYFLHAAFEAGLLQALRTPASHDKIVVQINPQRPELLQALLDQGVAAGELYLRDGLYGLRGKRAKALASADGDALAAMVQELVSYHGSVFTRLASRIHGAPEGDYLSATGTLIARSSRMFEPFIRDFARQAATAGSPRTLLEIGCGSGAYLRHAAEANPDLTGEAIDMQEEVVAHAKDNLFRWGIDKRFKVRAADIRKLPEGQAARFDLITLYNNIYYFQVPERSDLFCTIRSLLSNRGVFALVSTMSAPETAHFDLVLQSTAGCAPLPKLEELTAQLRESGFNSVRTKKLMPGFSFYGVMAALN